MEPGVGALLGMRPDQILDHRLLDLIAPDDRHILAPLGTNEHVSRSNIALRFLHGRRSSPIALEVSIVGQTGGHRVVLSDVLSWRMVERGAAEVPHFGDLSDHSSAVVLRLDQQCRPLATNQAWNHLMGPVASGDGLEWLRAFDVATVDLFRQALPGMCNGSSFGTSAYLRSADGRIDRFTIAACSLLTPTREFSGFLVVGCTEPPLNAAESVLVGNTVKFRPQQATTPVASESPRPLPKPIIDTRQPEVESAPRLFGTESKDAAVPSSSPQPTAITVEPDPMTRLAIASVLAAARNNFSGFADDEPGLFDVPASGEEIRSLIEPIRLDPHAKADLIDHLDAYHEDGMDSVVTVALLFLDVSRQTGIDGGQDHSYELKVLERRLRTAVRDHEYAAPLDGQGFVVAARGTFTAADLEALAHRLVARLESPLRGYGTSGGPQIFVTGVCSTIGESDEELLIRSESARQDTLAHQRRMHLIA
jgi:GGDEF domain-containing protein